MDQLGLYNSALLLCGERFLSSLTEEREPRRLLDKVWADGGVTDCLEMGQWNFAMRTVQIDYDSSIEPDFGYTRAFDKPTDWVLTSAVCEDEFFREPLTQYVDESNYWYSDLDTIYVRYVSSDVGYGMNINLWPGSFTDFVAEYFANKIIRKLTRSDAEEARSEERLKKKLLTAKSRAAMAQPTAFLPQGSWGRARTGGRRHDRGNSNSGNLIG